MSVADLEKPIQSGNTTTVERPKTVARPAARTKKKAHVRMNVRIDERTVAQPKPALLMASMLFVGLFTITYTTSCLVGQVRVEKARRTEIMARERAKEARRTEASLRARVDALTSAVSIESWAEKHGFAVPKSESADAPAKDTGARAGYVAHR